MKSAKNSIRSVAGIIALLVAAGLASRREKPSSPHKGYVIGQIADQEVVAPGKITVVDPIETERRRQIEAEKVPAMFRFKERAAEEAVAAFNADFKSSRKKFLDAVEKNYKKRKLSTNQVIGPRFRGVYTAFKTKHTTFPATAGQALKWAQGNAQEELQKQFREKLRGAARKYICPDEVPSRASGPMRVLKESATGSAEALLEQSQSVSATELRGLSKARNALASSFRAEDQVVSDVLTNFLRVNCTFDSSLTAQLRADRTNAIWALIDYLPGQVIVQRGHVIDAKTKAALEQLNGMGTGANPLSRKQTLLWALAAFCAALALWMTVRIFVNRRRNALIPIGNVLVLPTGEQTPESLETRLMPYLAKGLMNKLVRGLISQRSESIQTQNAGAEQLNELEQRLEQISARLLARQTTYEKRIAELEKELIAAEEENRELIRAKIREARQNLEWAKEKSKEDRSARS